MTRTVFGSFNSVVLDGFAAVGAGSVCPCLNTSVPARDAVAVVVRTLFRAPHAQATFSKNRRRTSERSCAVARHLGIDVF